MRQHQRTRPRMPVTGLPNQYSFRSESSGTQWPEDTNMPRELLLDVMTFATHTQVAIATIRLSWAAGFCPVSHWQDGIWVQIFYFIPTCWLPTHLILLLSPCPLSFYWLSEEWTAHDYKLVWPARANLRLGNTPIGPHSFQGSLVLPSIPWSWVPFTCDGGM